MAVSYTYEILSLRKKDIESNTDTVYHVQWKMKGVDDTDNVFGEHHGAVSYTHLPLPTILRV